MSHIVIARPLPGHEAISLLSPSFPLSSRNSVLLFLALPVLTHAMLTLAGFLLFELGQTVGSCHVTLACISTRPSLVCICPLPM